MSAGDSAMREKRRRVYHVWARLLFVQRSLAETACQAAMATLPEGESADDVFAAQLQTFIGPWSNPLQRQLWTTAKPVALLAEQRALLLAEEWPNLTPEEQSLLRQPPTDHGQGRRERTTLYLALLERLQAVLPDEAFEWPSHHVEVARLILQMVHDPNAEEARLLLETLLLGDSAAQGFYHRFMALVCECDLLLHPLPVAETTRRPSSYAVTRRERWVTIAFVAAVVVALAYFGRLLIVR